MEPTRLPKCLTPLTLGMALVIKTRFIRPRLLFKGLRRLTSPANPSTLKHLGAALQKRSSGRTQMTDVPAPHRHFQANFQTNLIAGLLTVTPLIVVWLVFDFFLTTLSDWGHPLAVELTIFLDAHYPVLRPFLDNDAVRYAIGVVVALLALYTIGAVGSRVVGQQLILVLENIISRVPGVHMVYSAA